MDSKRFWIPLALATVALLAACGGGAAVPTPTWSGPGDAVQPTAASATAEEFATPTAEPTITPTPMPTLRSVAAPHAGWAAYTNGDAVKQIVFDAEGRLWSATEGGVVRFDPFDGTYVKYTTVDGLCGNDVRAVAAAPDGTLWFGAHLGGVSRLDGPTWTTYAQEDGLASGFVEAIAIAPDGTIWFGGSSVSRFDGQRWTTYNEENGLPPGFGYVRAIVVAPDGAVWFATGAGATRFDGQAWVTYTQEDGLAGNLVEDIAVAPDGTLWFACGLDGLSHYNGRDWTTYTAEDGALDMVVQSVAVAADGTVWSGGTSSVTSFDGANWVHYEAEDGNPLHVTSIVPGAEGRTWVGTAEDGILYIEADTWGTLKTGDALPENDIRSVAGTLMFLPAIVVLILGRLGGQSAR
jgi:ligand-binding sensor domain-containing protein